MADPTDPILDWLRSYWSRTRPSAVAPGLAAPDATTVVNPRVAERERQERDRRRAEQERSRQVAAAQAKIKAEQERQERERSDALAQQTHLRNQLLDAELAGKLQKAHEAAGAYPAPHTLSPTVPADATRVVTAGTERATALDQAIRTPSVSLAPDTRPAASVAHRAAVFAGQERQRQKVGEILEQAGPLGRVALSGLIGAAQGVTADNLGALTRPVTRALERHQGLEPGTLLDPLQTYEEQPKSGLESAAGTLGSLAGMVGTLEAQRLLAHGAGEIAAEQLGPRALPTKALGFLGGEGGNLATRQARLLAEVVPYSAAIPTSGAYPQERLENVLEGTILSAPLGLGMEAIGPGLKVLREGVAPTVRTAIEERASLNRALENERAARASRAQRRAPAGSNIVRLESEGTEPFFATRETTPISSALPARSDDLLEGGTGGRVAVGRAVEGNVRRSVTKPPLRLPADNAMYALARTGVGAAVGGTQGDTLEEHAENAALGAIGALVGPRVVGRLIEGPRSLQALRESGIAPEAGAVTAEPRAERVRAAALYDPTSDRIFLGMNHAEAMNELLRAHGIEDPERGLTVRQSQMLPELTKGLREGFVTTGNRFLSREEAATLAKQAQQARPGARVGERLYSEDVFNRRGSVGEGQNTRLEGAVAGGAAGAATGALTDKEDRARGALIGGAIGAGAGALARRLRSVRGAEAEAAESESPVQVHTTRDHLANPEVRSLADDYLRQHRPAGVDRSELADRTYHAVPEGEGRLIADHYHQAASEPTNPKVLRSYEALKRETKAQYEHAVKAGFKFEPWTGEGQPYANSQELRDDVRKNKHMYFFLTENGFGQDAAAAGAHPLLESAGVSADGVPLTYNDLFRAVHDLYGHAKEGMDFGPRGEHNAWVQHSRMFSREARPAMSWETRGQNSWVNFGPHLRRPDGSIPMRGDADFQPLEERPYAEQKVNVLPERFTRVKVGRGHAGSVEAGPRKEPGSREKVVAAAYRLPDGTVESGPYHGAILDRMGLAEDAEGYLRDTEDPELGEVGFLTDRGRFLSREQAGRLHRTSVERPSSEDLPFYDESAYTEAATRPNPAQSEARKGEGGTREKLTIPIAWPPAGRDGSLELTHYGPSVNELDALDPAAHGTGQSGAERKRRAAYPELYQDRTYFYAPGAAVESRFQGLPSVTVRVPREGIATEEQFRDFQRQARKEAPAGLGGDQNYVASQAEVLARQAGYEGYQRGGVVAKFTPTPTRSDGVLPGQSEESFRPRVTTESGGIEGSSLTTRKLPSRSSVNVLPSTSQVPSASEMNFSSRSRFSGDSSEGVSRIANTPVGDESNLITAAVERNLPAHHRSGERAVYLDFAKVPLGSSPAGQERVRLQERYLQQSGGGVQEQSVPWHQTPGTLQGLIQQAKESLPLYRSEMARWAREAGPETKVLIAPLKSEPSIQDKLARKGAAAEAMGLKSHQRLGDLVRGTLLAPSLAGAKRAVEQMEHDGAVVDVADYFARPTAFGYGAYHLQTRLPNGHIAEVQVTTPALWDAREFQGGHAIYDRYGKSPVRSERELDQAIDDLEFVRTRYNEATRQAEAGEVPAPPKLFLTANRPGTPWQIGRLEHPEGDRVWTMEGHGRIVVANAGSTAAEAWEKLTRMLRSRSGSVTAEPRTEGPLAGTKVVDESGEPKRVFHGTPYHFQDFDLSRANDSALYGPGFYFTDDPRTAGGDGTVVRKGYSNIRNQDAELYNSIAAEQEQGRAALKRLYDFESRFYTPEQIEEAAGKIREDLAFGEEQLRRLEPSLPRPNVRPARLAIKHPFDVDEPVSWADLARLADTADEVLPGSSEKLRAELERHGKLGGALTEADRQELARLDAIPGARLTPEQVERQRALYLKDAVGAEPAPRGEYIYNDLVGSVRANHETVRQGSQADPRATVNEILKRAGYDGITHLGGRITGNEPHRVWIAFDRSQIRSAFGPARLADQAGAVEVGPGELPHMSPEEEARYRKGRQIVTNEAVPEGGSRPPVRPFSLTRTPADLASVSEAAVRKRFLAADGTLSAEGKRAVRAAIPRGGGDPVENFTDRARQVVSELAVALGHDPERVPTYSDQRLFYLAKDALEQGTEAGRKVQAQFAKWDRESKKYPLRDPDWLAGKLRELEDSGYRRWYQQMHDAAASRRGLEATRSPHNPYENDLQLWTRLLVATSAGNKVEANIRQADKLLSLIAQGRQAEIFTQGWGRLSGEVYHQNIRRVLDAEPFSIRTQPKFHSFEGNLLGDLDSATVDEFALAGFGLAKKPTDLDRRYVIRKLQETADRLGWDVAETQAASWLLNSKGEVRPNFGGGAEILEKPFALPLLRGELTDRMSQNAPRLMQEARPGGFVPSPLGSDPSPGQVRAFTHDLEGALLNEEDGGDVVRDAIRAADPGLKPSSLQLQRIEGWGAYGGAVNPNVVIALHDQTPLEVVRQYTAGRGLVELQEAQFISRLIRHEVDIEPARARGETVASTFVLEPPTGRYDEDDMKRFMDAAQSAPEPEVREALSGATLEAGRITLTNLPFLGVDDADFKRYIDLVADRVPELNVHAFSYTSASEYLDGPREMARAFGGRPETLRGLSDTVRTRTLPVYLRWAQHTGADLGAVRAGVLGHADWIERAADALTRGEEIPPHPSEGRGAGLLGNESGSIETGPRERASRSERVDPDEYVNVAAFAADPTGQKRLRAEVQRVVKEQKLSKAPVTWEETREAAASIGADDLVKKGEASPLSRPEMLAARNVIQANTRLQAKLLRERASRIDLSRSREEEITRTLGAIRAQNDALLGSFIKSRSEAGRALNSLKILASQDLDPLTWLAQASTTKGSRLSEQEQVTVTRLVERARAALEARGGRGSFAPAPPTRGARAASRAVRDAQKALRRPLNRSEKNAVGRLGVLLEGATPEVRGGRLNAGVDPTQVPAALKDPFARSAAGALAGAAVGGAVDREEGDDDNVWTGIVTGALAGALLRPGRLPGQVAERGLPDIGAPIGDDALRWMMDEYRSALGRSHPAERVMARAREKIGRDLTPEEATRIFYETDPGFAADVLGAPVTNVDPRQARLDLVTYIAGLHRASAAEKGATMWKAGLLTNPTTHAVNFVGNTVHAVLDQMKDTPAAVADRIMASATGQRTKGGVSLQAARASFSGAKEGLHEAKLVLRGVPLDEALQKYDIPQETHFDNAILDTYANTVFRLLGASDRIFRAGALSRSLAEQSRVLAKNEGLSGAAARARSVELLQNPTDEMTLRAIHDAEVATFQDHTVAGRAMGDFARALNQLPVPLGDLVVPFRKTPGAVATRVVEYSPFGFLGGIADVARLYKALREGEPEAAGLPTFDLQRRAADRFGRATVGSALVAAGVLLAAQDRMTGAYPIDADERRRWKLEGRQANSFLFRGSWWDVGRLSPIGNLLALGANLFKAAASGDSQSYTDRAAQTLFAAISTVADQPFLTGISDVQEAITDPSNAGQYVRNQAGSVVPSGVRAVARGMDPVVRKPASAREALQASVPGMSRGVRADVNVLGRERKRSAGVIESLTSPLRRSADTRESDSVIREMARVGASIADLRRDPGESDAHYEARARAEGRAIRGVIAQLIAVDPDYRGARGQAALQRVEDPKRYGGLSLEEATKRYQAYLIQRAVADYRASERRR